MKPRPRTVVSVLILALALTGPGEAQADIPWVPFFDGEYLASIELLVSAEHSLAGGFSVALWGGLAYVNTREEQIGIHTTGLEAAIEPRWYVAGHEFLRAGAGRVLVEPYLSLSKATYSGAGYLEHDSAWLKTLGLRLVWDFDI